MKYDVYSCSTVDESLVVLNTTCICACIFPLSMQMR